MEATSHEMSVSSSTDEMFSPAEYVALGFQANGFDYSQECKSAVGFVTVKSAENATAGFASEPFRAVRSNNLNKLQELRTSGRSLDVSSPFGETLLHLACRRGMTDIAKFLVCESESSLMSIDSNGRTPLHLACFAKDVDFDLLKSMMEKAPGAMLILDTRGLAPFSYIPESKWDDCLLFLSSNRHLLRPSMAIKPAQQ